jgi:hypothetical protein
MTAALYLLLCVSVLGAADTAYYHEWRARLPALGLAAATELRLHAARDVVYALLFICLPWFSFEGTYVWVLIALLLTEVVLTLWDFVVEDWIRKPLGGVYPGERIMHALIGIVFGAMLATLWPVLLASWSMPDAIRASAAVGVGLRWTFAVMAVVVVFSAIRDACAAAGYRGAAWPWRVQS